MKPSRRVKELGQPQVSDSKKETRPTKHATDRRDKREQLLSAALEFLVDLFSGRSRPDLERTGRSGSHRARIELCVADVEQVVDKRVAAVPVLGLETYEGRVRERRNGFQDPQNPRNPPLSHLRYPV